MRASLFVLALLTLAACDSAEPVVDPVNTPPVATLLSFDLSGLPAETEIELTDADTLAVAALAPREGLSLAITGTENATAANTADGFVIRASALGEGTVTLAVSAPGYRDTTATIAVRVIPGVCPPQRRPAPATTSPAAKTHFSTTLDTYQNSTLQTSERLTTTIQEVRCLRAVRTGVIRFSTAGFATEALPFCRECPEPDHLHDAHARIRVHDRPVRPVCPRLRTRPRLGPGWSVLAGDGVVHRRHRVYRSERHMRRHRRILRSPDQPLPVTRRTAVRGAASIFAAPLTALLRCPSSPPSTPARSSTAEATRPSRSTSSPRPARSAAPPSPRAPRRASTKPPSFATATTRSTAAKACCAPSRTSTSRSRTRWKASRSSTRRTSTARSSNSTGPTTRDASVPTRCWA